MFRDIIVLILLYQFITCSVVAQPRAYISVAGGVGYSRNSFDSAFSNVSNPIERGPNLGIFYGRARRKGLGWETGVVYREVRYKETGVLYDSTKTVLDSNDILSRYTFILIPVWLTYSQPLSKKIYLRAKVGIYTGWKTFGQEKLTSRLYPNVNLYGFASGSRFPTMDTFGGQVGLDIGYQLNRHLSLGMNGTLVRDASALIHPFPRKIPTQFSDYLSSIVQFTLHYTL